MKRRIRSGKNGFTLLEVLIAVVIFSISLLAIVPLLFTAVNIDNDTLLKATAQKMVSERIDQLMARNTLATDGTDDGEDTRTVKNSVLTRTWTITAGTGNLRRIVVQVAFTQGGVDKVMQTEVFKGL